MWLLVLWAGVVALAATAVLALGATPDGASDGTPASGALILVVGVLALVLGVAATMGGWGMGWHGTHIGHMGADDTTPPGGSVPEATTQEPEASWVRPSIDGVGRGVSAAQPRSGPPAAAVHRRT